MQYGLIKYSVILPFQPPWTIPSIMTASTCVVAPESEEMPYLPEGTHGSKIALEAMLCGRCAILGKIMSKKAAYSLCRAGKHFIVVNPDNRREFSRKLKRVIDNPQEAHRIGSQAEKFLQSKSKLFQDACNMFIKNFQLTILKKQCGK